MRETYRLVKVCNGKRQTVFGGGYQDTLKEKRKRAGNDYEYLIEKLSD